MNKIVNRAVVCKRPPRCMDCVYSSKVILHHQEITVCKLFKWVSSISTQPENEYYIDVEYARSVEPLCGFQGKWFKPK
jgi:hypothetical protein